MSKNKERKTSGASTATVVGIAATATIAYLLFGPEGKRNQKLAKGWALKMKGEILDKLEKFEEVSAPLYEKVVLDIGERYKKLKTLNIEDVEKEIDFLKKNWNKIEKEAKAKIKEKANKRVAKKAVKKVAAKKAAAKKVVEKVIEKVEELKEEIKEEVALDTPKKKVAKKASKKVVKK